MTFPPLKSPLKFYAVVPTAEWVRRMVQAGADTVQLRCKTLSGEALRREIAECVAACAGSETQLFINDHWREAVAAGAYGVHLGQEDMDTADLAAIAAAGLRLGLSTHSVDELARALSVHPSYVASGAIFPTTTKQMPTAPQGLDKLREYVKQRHARGRHRRHRFGQRRASAANRRVVAGGRARRYRSRKPRSRGEGVSGVVGVGWVSTRQKHPNLRNGGSRPTLH